jgi:phospholipid/cholesterol/gamma-HCH transport system substrate-binding protein
MESVMKQVAALGPKITAAIDGINNGILTETNKQSLAAALSNIAALTNKIDHGFLTEANRQAVAATLSNVAAVTAKINTSEGTVGKFLTDPAFYNNLEEFSADVKANPWKLFYRPKGK